MDYQGLNQTYHPFANNPNLHLSPFVVPADDDHHHHDDGGGSSSTAVPGGRRRPFHLRVATFNILAQDYGVPGSLKHVRPHLLEWNHFRARMVCNIIKQLDADVLCLQEVDRLDSLDKTLRDMGYEMYQTDRPFKMDTCVMAYKHNKLHLKHKWELDYDKMVKEDAAVVMDQEAYLRHNVGQISLFEVVGSPATQFIVVNTHLFWNPHYAEVKTYQAACLMKAVERASHYGHTPVVICGDMNSTPDSDVVRLFEQGHVEVGRKRGWTQGDVRFLCDATLNRLCRWLRILGLDCALETAEEEQRRSINKEFIIFQKATEEGRVLLTTSRTAMKRRGCPHSFFIESQQLESSFVKLCRHYSIELDESRFLSVCVKCNGQIILRDTPKSEEDYPPDVPRDVPLYHCVGCEQVYWMSDKETSHPMRAKQLALRLYGLATDPKGNAVSLEALEDEDGGDAEGMMVVDGEGAGDDDDDDVCSGGVGSTTNFSHGMRLVSAYVDSGGEGEVAHTNLTPGFSGALDHIFYDDNKWKLTGRLELPKRHDGRVEGYLPSQAWPSDHICLACDFDLLVS